MNDETRQYFDSLFTHENNLPHAPQTEHIIKREVIDKNLKYTRIKDGISYTNSLPLINITRGTCPECNCKTYSYDMWRGEKVCPQCGLVLEEGIAQQPFYQDKYRKPKKGLTYEEKKFLRKNGHGYHPSDVKEWMNNYDNNTLKCLTGQAQLNRKQQMETKYIIDTIGFIKLHNRATKPEIICAVIRYVLKKTQVPPTLLRYNQGIFKNILTEDIYTVVENNIKKHMNSKEICL